MRRPTRFGLRRLSRFDLGRLSRVELRRPSVIPRALLALGLVLASAVVHLDLPVTRRILRAVIAEAVSNAMRGDLSIGDLDRLGADAIVVRNVELFDGEGRRVVHAERLMLVPDWSGTTFGGLSLRTLRFSSAHLDGASAWLVDQGDGLPTLIRSFDASTDEDEGGGGGEPVQVDVSGIEITQLTLEGDLLGLRDLRAEGVRARGRLVVRGDVHVTIEHADADVVRPFGFPGRIDALTGTISTVAHEGVALHARGHYGAERASAKIRFAEPRGGGASVLGVDVQAEQLTTGTIQALRFDFVPDLACPLTGSFSLVGPIGDFDYRGDFDTVAGKARLTGTTRSATGQSSITITSSSLALAKVWEGAPEITAQGLLRVDVDEALPHPRLHVELEPLVYERFAIPGFAFDGALAPEGLRIDALRARSEHAKLEGGGTIDKSGALDIAIKAHFDDIGRDQNLRRFVPNARGRVDADVKLRTSGLGSDFVHARGRVAFARLRYQEVSADKLLLTGYVHGAASRPRAKLVVNGKALKVGAYLLGDPTLTLEGGPKVYRAKGQFDDAGKRTFDVDATITAEPKGFLVQADSLEVAVGNGTWRGALTGLRVRDDVIELGELRLASRSQRLEAKGIVRLRGPDEIDAQLQDFDLAVVRALVGDALWLERGRADANVVLRGDIEDPFLDVQGALREGAVAGIEDVNAVYLVRYANGSIEVDGEVDLGERGMLQVRGSGSIDPSVRDRAQALRYGSYDLEVSSDGLVLGLIPELARRGVSGRVGGAVRFRGTLADPDASGRIELAELTLPGTSPLDLALEGTYIGDLLRVDIALADARGPLATAGGQLALPGTALREGGDAALRALARGPWQLRGQTTARRLSAMPAPLRDAVPYAATLSTTFDLARDDGKTHGALELDALWEAALPGTTCATTAKPRVRGTATVRDGQVELKLATLIGPWRIGEFDAQVAADVDGWLDARKVTLPALAKAKGRISVPTLKRMPYLCQYGDGSLVGEVELDRGEGREPLLVLNVDGTFAPTVRKQKGGKEATLESCAGAPITLETELSATGTVASGSAILSGCHGGAATLSGRLPVEWDSLYLLPLLDPDGQLDVAVRFDDAQLKPLLERLPGINEAEALARGEATVQGTPSHPAVAGYVDVRRGRLYLLAMGQTLDDVTGRLELRGNWIKIDRLSARDGGGLLELAGGIGLDGLVPDRARVAVRAERMPIKQEGVDLGVLTGAAAIDARFEPTRTRAELTLHALAVRLPDTSNRTLQALSPHADVVLTTAVEAPEASDYTIELRFDGQRGLSVRRNDFEAQVGTQLELRLGDRDLRAAGFVQFLGGEFEVFGKRFEINHGSLRFDPKQKELDPDVFLLATQKPEGGGLSPVTVTVTGTLGSPTIAFASDACPGEAGAVTYLISGQCASDDPDLAAESSGAQQAFASGMLSGVLTLGAQKELSAVMPRIAVASDDRGSSVKAGFSSTELVPKWMRPVVRRVYVQGGLSTPSDTASTEASSTEPQATPSPSLDFLLELYFPHDLVGSGRFGQHSWGLDVTWEP